MKGVLVKVFVFSPNGFDLFRAGLQSLHLPQIITQLTQVLFKVPFFFCTNGFDIGRNDCIYPKSFVFSHKYLS